MNKKLLGLILTAMLISSPLQAQEGQSVLRTSGFGMVTAKPDMATFSVAVDATKNSAKDAKQEVDQVVTSFLAELEKAGIDRAAVTSGNINIMPRYNNTDGKRELVGYQGVRQVIVNVYDIENLNKYLDVALDAGINRIDQIELKIKDSTLYQQKARRLAIEDAQQKAKAVANGFDSQISGIVSIDYQSNSYRPIMPKAVMAMEARASADASYQDTMLDISDTVNVEYKIEPEKLSK